MILITQEKNRSVHQGRAVNIIYSTESLSALSCNICVQAGTSVSGWRDEQTGEEPDHQVRRALVNGSY